MMLCDLAAGEPVFLHHPSPSSGTPTIQAEERLALNCSATGFPVPSLSWRRDNDQVDTYNITSSMPNVYTISSVLVIEMAAVSDRGMYLCEAAGDAGHLVQSDGIQVEVTCE